MDQTNEDPSEICSYNVNQVIHEGIGDLNKKRKILDELLGSPPAKAKWRFRDEGYCFEHSEMDSNSMVGETNSASSPSTESTTYQTELPKSSLSSFNQSSSFASQSFTSSGRESNSSLKDSVSSSDSTSMEEEEEEEKEEEEESPMLKGQGLLGNYADHSYSEHEIEEFLDMKSEELVLYSTNAATSDLYVLSSGRWNINKGNPHILFSFQSNETKDSRTAVIVEPMLSDSSLFVS
ncbi:hypothetical protein Scep_005392 [Stephania cephalantha]|uniref:Uncharacterized protein n=1 Tax=Stephania cephalantha TaxID=152367 RepID=A0AAP0KU74_9MAGN